MWRIAKEISGASQPPIIMTGLILDYFNAMPKLFSGKCR
jgi:hypothetical protein